MKSKKIILTIFTALLFFLITYINAFYYQLESKMNYYEWAQFFYELKNKRISEIGNKNKIIIISGSNSHYSINSEIIQNKFKKPVVNLAFWIGNDMNFFYHQLDEVVNDGDIVVMPLEFPYYYRVGMDNRFMSEMMIWGKDIYIDKLNFLELSKFILDAEPQRIIKGIINKIKYGTINDNNHIKKDIDKVSTELFNKVVIQRDNHKINKYGDKIVPLTFINKKNVPNEKYLQNKDISAYFINNYKKIEKLIKKRNATLFLLYPVTLQSELFDLKQIEYRNKILTFERELAKSEIHIKCNSALSHFDKYLFYDSPNHLIDYGRELRTNNLTLCLDKLINKIDYNLSTDDILNKNNEYTKLVKKNIKIDMKNYENDLYALKNALNEYYKENGSYPISKGYDGIYTKWGDSKEDWIVGLVPKYISSLPKDPRNTNDPSKQYLYKSNGKDYKLIFHNFPYTSLYKNFIDPKRKRNSIGIWTEGAKNW